MWWNGGRTCCSTVLCKGIEPKKVSEEALGPEKVILSENYFFPNVNAVNIQYSEHNPRNPQLE